MPKVDLNPLQSGGKANVASLSGLKRYGFLIVSFALFFVAMAFGQDLAGKIQTFIANVTGMETQENGPTIKVA